MRMDRIHAKKRWNQKGAIEGLPLQLIIMVVIAGVAIVVIMAWLQPWKNKVDLQSISVTPGAVTKGAPTLVTITAFDTKNNKLAGVAVVLSGCGVSISGTTDSTGTVKFTIAPTLPPGTVNGQVDITATYTGTMTLTRTNQILVS